MSKDSKNSKTVNLTILVNFFFKRQIPLRKYRVLSSNFVDTDGLTKICLEWNNGLFG